MIRFLAGVAVGAFSAAYVLAWWLSATPEWTDSADLLPDPFKVENGLNTWTTVAAASVPLPVDATRLREWIAEHRKVCPIMAASAKELFKALADEASEIGLSSTEPS